MPSGLGKGIQRALLELDWSEHIPFNDDIPLEPQAFYTDFGLLQHPRTRQPVEELADYQIKVWKVLLEKKRVLVVKSHKCGLSTSQLMADFQLAVLPTSHPLSSRGFDTLLISQTKEIAKELLRTLRRMILHSTKFSKYLIDKPTEIEEYGTGSVSYKAIMKDEQTKTSVIYLRNPEDETRPCRIIALGADNPGSIESWPSIHHIHCSDIVATIGDYSESLNVALTRLANTNGTIVIESIPDFDGSPLHKMFDNPRSFAAIKITADEALAAGVITKEHLDSEKERLGSLYPQYYGASFLTAGNAYYPYELFQSADEQQQGEEPWEVTA